MAHADNAFMIELLKRIQADLASLRGEVSSHRAETREGFAAAAAERSELAAGISTVSAELAQLSAKVSRLDADTVRGFERVIHEDRQHRDFSVDKLREHEERITRLEGLVPPHP